MLEYVTSHHSKGGIWQKVLGNLMQNDENLSCLNQQLEKFGVKYAFGTIVINYFLTFSNHFQIPLIFTK